MGRAALWLAWRELIDQKRGFVLAVSAMAAAVAFCTAAELLHRSREVAVSAGIDQMGAGLTVIPGGLTSRNLQRAELDQATLPAGVRDRLARLPEVRAIDQRLVLRGAVSDVPAMVIGVEPDSEAVPDSLLHGLVEGQAILGHELAVQLERTSGDTVRHLGQDLTVVDVLSSSASAEDFAMFVNLKGLQGIAGRPDSVNVIHLFPLPGSSRTQLRHQIESRIPGVSVIVPDHDDSTREAIDEDLSQHRWIFYGLTALVVAFSLFLWSNLNAAERLVEMATLVAMGGSGRTVFAVLALRAGLVGLCGALVGYALGAVLAWVQDPGVARAIIWSPGLLLGWAAAAVCLSVGGALPVSLLSAFREHVRSLQQ